MQWRHEEEEEPEVGHPWLRRGSGLTDLKAGYETSQVAEVVVFRGMSDTKYYNILFTTLEEIGETMLGKSIWMER